MNRYKLLLCVLFMSIGFAAVNTSLSIGNNTDISNILEEFDVYFSDVRVNGVQDYSPVANSNTLSFKASVFDKDYIVQLVDKLLHKNRIRYCVLCKSSGFMYRNLSECQVLMWRIHHLHRSKWIAGCKSFVRFVTKYGN